MRRHHQGAALAAIAAVLMLIVLLGALLLGISYRLTQRQRAKSALGEATRTTAQFWNYDQFANATSTWNRPQGISKEGQHLLIANLANVPGLSEPPHQAATKAQWQLLAEGGTCEDRSYSVAVICGSLELEVRSFPLGFGGTQTIRVESAVILDETP